MTDETNKIVQELFQKSHRFLAENEVVSAALEAKLSLFETNAVIEAFLEAAKRYARGGYDVIVDGIIGPWFLKPWGSPLCTHSCRIAFASLL